MDAGKKIDEIAKDLLDKFEAQDFKQIGYNELLWLQVLAANELYKAVNAGLIPPYRGVEGDVRTVEMTSDVEVVYRGDIVRLGLRFYDEAGQPEKRYYRRKSQT